MSLNHLPKRTFIHMKMGTTKTTAITFFLYDDETATATATITNNNNEHHQKKNVKFKRLFTFWYTSQQWSSRLNYNRIINIISTFDEHTHKATETDSNSSRQSYNNSVANQPYYIITKRDQRVHFSSVLRSLTLGVCMYFMGALCKRGKKNFIFTVAIFWNVLGTTENVNISHHLN